MPTDMPKCETCKHWDCEAPSETGVCRNYDDPRFETEAEHVISNLLTRSDFGCIAHEPRSDD